MLQGQHESTHQLVVSLRIPDLGMGRFHLYLRHFALDVSKEDKSLAAALGKM